MAMKYKYVEVPKAEDEDESKSGELALKETQFSKKNGIDNTSFKGDEQG